MRYCLDRIRFLDHITRQLQQGDFNMAELKLFGLAQLSQLTLLK
jgi:hypothetical protein